MAKKGGVQQLQADINTDEEFEKFLERQGLLVLDVYSEWCGPCLGMVGSLKKIKLELGGDNLHLAVCKSDTINYLKRFNKKSEPTWLFVTQGKAVNLMFGTNVPRLIRLIASELELLNVPLEKRKVYEIMELQPEEVERLKVKQAAREDGERIEKADRDKKRLEYLNFVTDSIMQNLPDYGVTVFGPQVNRDMFKKIMEPADALKIQCKDRRVMPVNKESFETVNFACNNPLEAEILDQLHEKELLVCFWKLPDEPVQSVPEVLRTYANELTKARTEITEEGEKPLGPIIGPREVTVEYEIEEEKEVEEVKEFVEKEEFVADATGMSDFEGDEEGENLDQARVEDPEIGMELNEATETESAAETKEEQMEDSAPKTRIMTKVIQLPPIWTPYNARGHAALIYTFFRPQTATFLPPDPEPEPPHIIMAFDAYKKKDLIDLVEQHKANVPFIGFFTTDNPDNTQFIANSVEKYAQHTPHAPTDKLILKVIKWTSETMLALATYGPSFVSPNTVTGREDALKFFPPGFKSAEQEILEAKRSAELKAKKKRKAKKNAEAEGEAGVEGATATSVEGTAATGEEGTTTSGEDSGDSIAVSGEGESEEENGANAGAAT